MFHRVADWRRMLRDSKTSTLPENAMLQSGPIHGPQACGYNGDPDCDPCTEYRPSDRSSSAIAVDEVVVIRKVASNHFCEKERRWDATTVRYIAVPAVFKMKPAMESGTGRCGASDKCVDPARLQICRASTSNCRTYDGTELQDCSKRAWSTTPDHVFPDQAKHCLVPDSGFGEQWPGCAELLRSGTKK